MPGGAPDDSAQQLSSAERLRKQGRCSKARGIFNGLTDDADASVRARALAGLGLCAVASGDDKTASSFFSRAKKADASVAGFIDRERAKLEPEEPVQQAL